MLLTAESSKIHRKLLGNYDSYNFYALGRSPAEIVGSNPTGGMDICLL